jgi:hypothetical protein
VEGAGDSPRKNSYNLIFHNTLIRNHRRAGGPANALAGAPPVKPKAVGNWPKRSVLAGLLLLAATPPTLAGCGHATVPCPTPTSELDRLRDETEGAREETDRAGAEADALEARRDAAEQRAAAARAALDSLGPGTDR